MSSSHSKKRKRGDDKEKPEYVKIVVDKSTPSGPAPVLATFPSVDPPSDLKFNQYYLPDRRKPDASVQDRPNFIFAETDKVQFTSSNHDQGQTDKGYFSQYVVGVYNKRTKTLTLPSAPTPLHIVAHEVTALKNLDPIQSRTSAETQRLQAKNALGEAFGTKKAKSAIRAMERDKIDVSSMQGVASHLQSSIEAATSSLPTQEEAVAIADSNRPIPPVNMDAKTPSEAYPLDSIIPPAEFKSLSISNILNASSQEERLTYFPMNRGEWIQTKLTSIFKSSKPRKTNVKILLYISILWSFKLMAFKVHDKSILQERLSGVPYQVIDGLVSRFTESRRGSSGFEVTPHMEIKLLNYLFALCLRLDDFSTQINTLAADLHMSASKYVHLHSISSAVH
ncbi:DNA-directed RNA polymerase I subunit rpa49 [Tulasnella sp. 418]|nr:DNA-directed RNA polymerase I subunit rpa49 [Tulasnella sp. 418]